jgi:GntR family transcriptional regulator of arabinose operon
VLNDLVQEGLLYRLQGKGTFVASTRPQKNTIDLDQIAIVISSKLTEVLFSDILSETQSGAAENGFDLIFSDSKNDARIEFDYIERLKNKVKGFIIFPSDNYAWEGLSRKALTDLKNENLPFVLIDRRIPDFEANFVGTDNFAGAYEAVSELFRENYESVACLTCNDWRGKSALVERLEGYKKAVRDCGKKEIILEVERGNPNLPAVENFMGAKRNSAIFSTENLQMDKVLNIASKHNLNIPNDLGIITFDKTRNYTPIPLSIVSQPMKEIGERAAKILIEKIKSGRTNECVDIKLKPKLILAESTRNKKTN